MDSMQVPVQSRRRHSNAGHGQTVPLYNIEGTSSDTLETINEISGRSRTRSFSRGIKDLFRGNKQKSAAGSASNSYTIPTVAVHPPVSDSPDGKPPTGNGTESLPYWAIQPRKSQPVTKQPPIPGRPRSNSEVIPPLYHKFNEPSSSPSSNGAPPKSTGTVDGPLETSTPMSHLLSSSTGGARGPPTTPPRVGPTEFLELYKSLTYGSGSAAGDPKLAAARSRRFESPVAYNGRRRTSIAVTPQSGFLRDTTWTETVIEQPTSTDRLQRPLRTLSKSPCPPPPPTTTTTTNTSPTHPTIKDSLLDAVGYHRRPRRYSAPSVDVGLLRSRFGGGQDSKNAIKEEQVAEALSNFPKFTANTPVGLTSADTSDAQSQKHVIIWRDRINGTRVFTLPGPDEDEDSTHMVEDYGNDEKTFITKFMKQHRCYELMPSSSKLILFDINLEVICAFYAMLYNGIKAAPIWDGNLHKFVGMMTVTDFIRILQRCYRQRGNFDDIEKHRISDWREMLNDDLKLDITIVDPNDSLSDAIVALRKERVHRLLVIDSVGGNALCILSYKRILRFLYQSASCLPRPDFMSKSIGELEIGTYNDVITVTLKTPLIDTLNLLIEHRISAVPVVNEFGRLINIYTKFDTINLARDQLYTNLNCSMDEALSVQRDSFEGLYTCKKTDSLENVIHWFVKAEIHRMVVVDEAGRVRGIVSLSDLVNHLVLPEIDDTDAGSESSDDYIIAQF